MPVERAQVNRANLPAGRARIAEPRQPGRNRGAYRRIEPQRAPARLTRIPDSNDLLRLGDGRTLALMTTGPSSVADRRGFCFARAGGEQASYLSIP
jgi:hypothetical protein